MTPPSAVQNRWLRWSEQAITASATSTGLTQCTPAPGCTLAAKPLSTAGEPDLTAWQYSQSPRRPEITKSCGATYAADGNCYAPGFSSVFLDMDIASSADPSHGR